MPQGTLAPAEGRTETPATDLDAIYHQEAHRPCEARVEADPRHCPEPATWLVLCWCSNCDAFEGAACDGHQAMLRDCMTTDTPIRHRRDDGSMLLRRLRRL